MLYYVRRSGDDELVHGLGSWKNKATKYLAKIQRGGNTVYIYTQQQLENLRKGVSGAIAKIRRKAEDVSGITAKNRMRVNKLRAGSLTYQARKASQNKSKPGYTRHLELGIQADKAAQNATRYEKEYKKSLVGKLDNVSKFFKSESRAQKKTIKKAASAGKKGLKKRLKDDPLYLQRGLSVNGSTPQLKIREKKIREKKTYEKPKRDRIRRGGKPYVNLNGQSPDGYKYFNKDEGWATNSKATAHRISGTKGNKKEAPIYIKTKNGDLVLTKPMRKRQQK